MSRVDFRSLTANDVIINGYLQRSIGLMAKAIELSVKGFVITSFQPCPGLCELRTALSVCFGLVTITKRPTKVLIHNYNSDEVNRANSA